MAEEQSRQIDERTMQGAKKTEEKASVMVKVNTLMQLYEDICTHENTEG